MNALSIGYDGLDPAEEVELRRHEPLIREAAGGRADLELVWRADRARGGRRRGVELVVRRRGSDWPPPARCLLIPDDRLSSIESAVLAHGVKDAVQGLP
jgi:hypothetical protein